MAITISKTNELLTRRVFTFGKEGSLFFDAQNYPTLKKIFDEVQVRDRHTMAIKQDRGEEL